MAADPGISGADCRIEWRGGGSERSEAAIEAALDALIARRFSTLKTS
jgi:flagellar assembly protein FliH